MTFYLWPLHFAVTWWGCVSLRGSDASPLPLRRSIKDEHHLWWISPTASQPHTHSLSLHTGQGNKARGEALYDLPQRLEVSTASPSVIYHLGCGDKCFKESSIHGTKEALAYISLPSLLCQIWSVVWSPGNMIRRRSVAWSATRASVCVDEDTTAGYVVTSSANSAHLSSLSTKPVRAWKIFFSVN